ncbi:MAG: hypothetical protein K8L97_01215 [Anaerolineae bacterium]|nr:hypothetical protein [Anaerolineae bacterium]
MSQLSLSAVDTGSAVVCSATFGYCRRPPILSFGVRQRGKLALGVVSLRLSVVSFWSLGMGGLLVFSSWLLVYEKASQVVSF